MNEIPDYNQLAEIGQNLTVIAEAPSDFAGPGRGRWVAKVCRAEAMTGPCDPGAKGIDLVEIMRFYQNSDLYVVEANAISRTALNRESRS